MRQTPGDTIETIPLRLSRRRNLVAAVSFVLGGSLFALGAVLAQLDVGRLVTVNVTYLVWGFFFSLGGYVSILLAPPHQRRSAVALFVGTLLFAVSLVGAFAEGLTSRQSNGWIWLPDILGWWVVAVNQLGSILSFLAGIAAFTRPATSHALDIGLVNWGTFAGAVCFAAGGVIQAFDTSTPTRTVVSTAHDDPQ